MVTDPAYFSGMPSGAGQAYLPSETNITHLQRTYQLHRDRFMQEEKAAFDCTLALLNGKSWALFSGQLGLPAWITESDMLKTSVNLVFAIRETGRAMLAPRNLKCTARIPGSAPDSDQALRVESYMNDLIRSSGLESEERRAIDDRILFGRSIKKHGWDVVSGTPFCRTADLYSVFFDLEAKRPSDIRYWMECTPVSATEFSRRIRSGVYPNWAAEVASQAYPTWMRRMDTDASRGHVQSAPWYLVYEYYDVEHGKVYHFTDADPRPLLVDDLHFVPYEVTTYNDNGIDCRGLSEIQLVLNSNIELNTLFTLMLELVRSSNPNTYYDRGALDGQDLEEGKKAKVGALVGVTVPPDKHFSECFFPQPLPETPAMLPALADKLWSNVQYVSAMADAARGQTMGAKTATELAFIDAQLKNRLMDRQGETDASLRRTLEMYLYLSKLYLRDDAKVQVLVNDLVAYIGKGDLQAFVKVELQPYTATATTRQVQAEAMFRQWPVLQGNPLIDQRKLLSHFLVSQDLPLDLLIPANAPPAAPSPLPVPQQPGKAFGATAGVEESRPVAPPTPQGGGTGVPSPEAVNPNPPLEVQ